VDHSGFVPVIVPYQYLLSVCLGAASIFSGLPWQPMCMKKTFDFFSMHVCKGRTSTLPCWISNS